MEDSFSKIRLAHLEHFTVLADELHFVRAAKKLGIEQPRLSRSIRQLEKAVGLPLFERSAHAVRLTPAGQAFLEEARRTLEQGRLAFEVTHRSAMAEEQALRIAIAPGALFGKAYAVAMRTFYKQWPRAKVVFEVIPSALQLDRLRNGTIDLAFLTRDAGDERGVETKIVESARYVAFVPSDWPMARRRSLCMADFANSPFIEPVPELRDAVLSACAAAGFKPQFVRSTVNGYVNLGIVASGVAMYLGPEVWTPIKGVTVVAVRDLPNDLHWTCQIAWIPRALPPPLAALVDQFESIAESAQSLKHR